MSNDNPLIGGVSDECSSVSNVFSEHVTVSPSGGEREYRAPDGQANGENIQGTPPSNTVPYNCNNEYFKLLRFGVDSLYLSYQGEMFPEVKERLAKLKQLAQHPEADQQAQAQYAIAGHIVVSLEIRSNLK